MPRFKRNGIHCSRFMSPENKFGDKRRLFVMCKPETNTVTMLNHLEQIAIERHMKGAFVKDSLADYFRDRFLPEYTAKRTLSKSMQELYRYMFEKILLPKEVGNLGGLSLRTFDGPTVNRLVGRLREFTKTTKGSKAGGSSKKLAKVDRPPAGITKRRFSDQTIRNTIVALVTLLRYAEYVKDIPALPKIDVPEVKEKKEATIYSRSETQLVVSKARDDYEYAALMLLYDAGLRASEVLGLTWAQIDYRTHIIDVKQQHYRKEGVKAPKKNRRRDAPMSAQLEAALGKIAGLGKGFVFQKPDGKPRTDSWLRHVFNTARRDAGLPPARLHDSRHTFSSRKTEEGTNPFKLQRLLGHADIRTTQDYVHVKAPQPTSFLDPDPQPESAAEIEAKM